MAARVYFSGLVDEINYIAAYPGHAPDSKHTVIAGALTIFAQSLHRQYLPDLIIRHGKGKTILLVDDICTQGNSFEAGRAFIEKVGANVVCLSWLKTINRDYNAVAGSVPLTNPYEPYTGTGKIPVVAHWYSSAIVDPTATTDMAQIHKRYYSWDWPADICQKPEA